MGGYLKYNNILVRNVCTVEDQQYIQLQEDYLLAKAKIGMKAEFERQKSLTKVKLVATKYSNKQSIIHLL
jgi:cobalt-zinc-cadmium efflux system membrane fusion protein